MAEIKGNYFDGTKVAVEAYRRILKAFKAGKGVRLSAEECECIITMDDAVVTAAENHWPWDSPEEGTES